MEYLIALALLVVVLSISITIHELGHYLVARLLNIKVTHLVIGFGLGLPPLYQTTLGEDKTLLIIYPFIIGGYINFLEWNPKDTTSTELNRTINKRSMIEQHFIALGGVVGNLFLAFILYTCAFNYGISGEKPMIGSVERIAAHAGLQAGDEITHLRQKRVMRWDTVINGIYQQMLFNQDAIVMTVLRNNQSIDIVLPLYQNNYSQIQNEDFFTMFGITPYRPPIKIIITNVHPNSPAAQSGIRNGDIIIQANHSNINSTNHWKHLLNSHVKKSLTINVLRKNQIHEFAVTPQSANGQGKIGVMVEYKFLNQDTTIVERHSILESINLAITKVINDIASVSLMIFKIFTFQLSPLNLSGVISLMYIINETLQNSVCHFLIFVATINTSIAISNLLPFYPLDGYLIARPHLHFMLGKRYTRTLHNVFCLIGISIVTSLILFSIVSDIIKWN